MFEFYSDFLTTWRASLTWAPDWLFGVSILVLAALLALAIHAAIVQLVRRLLRDRHPYLRSFVIVTRRLTRLAALVIAVFIALPAMSLDPEASTAVAKLLVLVSTILIGWGAITAVNTAADLYLMRFGLDTADQLLARKHITQVRLLTRAINTLLVIATIGGALMTFDAVRQYGVSLFASAGVAGLVAGLAARPLLSNLFAGIQIAVAQPIRIDDGVMVEGEYGTVEEITSTYVVLRLPDLRRLIVPLTYFIEKPFQNWTREAMGLIGSTTIYVDYTAPIDRIREKAMELVKASPLWDGQVAKLVVTDLRESTLEMRVVASARSSGDSYDLRCNVREKLIDFLQREIPTALPRSRQENVTPTSPRAG